MTGNLSLQADVCMIAGGFYTCMVIEDKNWVCFKDDILSFKTVNIKAIGGSRIVFTKINIDSYMKAWKAISYVSQNKKN